MYGFVRGVKRTVTYVCQYVSNSPFCFSSKRLISDKYSTSILASTGLYWPLLTSLNEHIVMLY